MGFGGYVCIHELRVGQAEIILTRLLLGTSMYSYTAGKSKNIELCKIDSDIFY